MNRLAGGIRIYLPEAPVAQLDRVSASEAEGCQFDPGRVHHPVSVRKKKGKMAPEAGIEPATNALTVHRSTAELLRKAVG